MFWIKGANLKIKRLLNEGTSQSLTHAALECRLAIERVCYEKLTIVHDYISHDDLKRWQPRYVVETIVQEVNEDAASSFPSRFEELSLGHTKRRQRASNRAGIAYGAFQPICAAPHRCASASQGRRLGNASSPAATGGCGCVAWPPLSSAGREGA